MQRSLFPDGVLLDTTALQFTELSKASEILRGRVDWTSRGVYSGGAITVGAVDNTRIDIAAFSGFAPNGEFVECTGNLASIQLDDSTLNAINYVVAFYTESETRNQPHETDGSTYATRATGSYRVRVYEESNYLALSSTDANLANDARDRGLILGKVTGNGVGVALTASNITSPTVYNNLLYADPYEPPSIPGVAIVGVSSDMSTGAGTLDYTYAVGPVYSLQWTSFGGGAGAAVNPTVDGTYTIFDGTGISYITVEVVVSMLSLTSPLSETVTIIDMYEQAIPRQTSEDYLHRNMIGSGVVSPDNPHGLSQDDISGSSLALEEHQDTMHSIGIWKGSSAAIFSGSISFPIGGDVLTIMAPAPTDLYYINGKKLNSLSPLSLQFIPSVVPSSASGNHFYEIGVDDEEVTYVTTKMSFPDPRTVTGCWIVDASDNYPVGGGSANLALTVMNPGTLTYAFSWDAGESVSVTAAQDPHIIRLFAANAEDWIDVYVNTISGEANPDYNLPAVGVYSDAVSILASADPSETMPLANLCGSWDATAAPARFAIGYPPYSITRNFIDKRIWGTLATDNMSDSALQELAYSPQDELHYSGVLYSRNAMYDNFEIYGTAGLVFSLRGGAYYCRGERITFEGDTGVTLVDNTVNLVYLDTDGAVGVLDVTADFAGSMEDALAYLVGGSRLLPETHLSQLPETGVALYRITTAGGVITDTLNVMRNINGPVDPWSVAAFTDNDVPRSSFDSLYSAFLYASNLDGRSLTITLTGTSTIGETITQPSGVNVKGQTQDEPVVILHIDASGAWILNPGCRVDDAFIYMYADGGTAIKPASGCTISRCYYSSFMLNSEVFLKSTSALSDVLVDACKVSTHSGAVVLTSSSNDQIRVRDLTVTGLANNSGFGHGLIHVLGNGLHIEKNKITTNNTTDMTDGIVIGAASSDFYVSKNMIQVGDGPAASPEYGIHVLGGTSRGFVTENTVTRAGAGTSQLGVGIGVLCGTDFNVVNNVVSSLGVAVQVYDGAGASTITNGRVCQNSITGAYHRAISVDLDAAYTPVVHGLKINDNRIYSCTKGAAGLPTWGNELYGIRFYIDVPGVGPYTTSVEGLQIACNDLSALLNTTDECYGIYIKHDALAGDTAGFTGMSVNGNTVSTFLGANNMTTAGIVVFVVDQDISVDNSIFGNTLSTWSSHAGAASAIYGIVARATANLAVNNNVVTMKGTTMATRCDGIYAVEGCTSVSGNSVTANWCGIYVQPSLCVVSGNSIVSGGIGIFVDAVALKTSMSNNLLDIYAYNDGALGHSGCGGIVCEGEGADIFDNKIVLTSTGGTLNVPDETAHIHVIGDGCNIVGNSTHLGADTATVGGAAPSNTHRAYHIYYRISGENCSISNNKIDNYENASNLAFNGLWMDAPVLTGDLFVLVNSNHIRGRTATTGAHAVPMVGMYPYEYRNLVHYNAGDHRWVVATGNIVTSEDIAENAAGPYPNIYFNTAVPIPQQPTGANRTNFATNWSPTNWW